MGYGTKYLRYSTAIYRSLRKNIPDQHRSIKLTSIDRDLQYSTVQYLQGIAEMDRFENVLTIVNRLKINPKMKGQSL